MRTLRLWMVLLAAAAIAISSVAFGKNVTVSIPLKDVTVRSNDLGDYYVVRFDLPTEIAGKRLDSVFLDMVVDASPTNQAVEGATPILSVLPLTEAFAATKLSYTSNVPSVRPVSMGEGQKVRFDITETVRGWIAHPVTNHGLVIGALSGPPVGTASLKDSALGEGVAMRLTYFYQNRSGERVSTK